MFKTIVLGIGTSLTAQYFLRKNTQNTGKDLSVARNAICILYPSNESNVTGIVSFQQENITASCKIVAQVRGLKPNKLHGFHIHEWGDLTEGCVTAGPHYNPWNKRHGGPLENERHIGDLGNLQADENGVAYYIHEDALIKLFGDTSVIGRSCVVHADQDDLGKGLHSDSATTGHSGQRVACGTIALSQQFKNLPPTK